MEKKRTAEAVRIRLVKEAGEEEWLPIFEADSADAAFFGLQVLLQEFCSLVGISVERGIALMAAQMLSNGDTDSNG